MGSTVSQLEAHFSCAKVTQVSDHQKGTHKAPQHAHIEPSNGHSLVRPLPHDEHGLCQRSVDSSA